MPPAQFWRGDPRSCLINRPPVILVINCSTPNPNSYRLYGVSIIIVVKISLLSRLQLLSIYAAKIQLSPCWRYSLLTAMQLSNIVYYHNLEVLYLSPGFSFVEVDRILDLGKPWSNILSPPQNISLVTNIRLLNYDNKYYIPWQL